MVNGMKFKILEYYSLTLFVLMILSFVFTYLIVIRPVEFFGVKNNQLIWQPTQDSGRTGFERTIRLRMF